MIESVWNLKKEANLQQRPDSKLNACLKECAEMIFKSGFTLKEAEKCGEECKSSHLQKPILNDLNEKLEISEKNLHDAQNLLPTVLAYDINQDSLF